MKDRYEISLWEDFPDTINGVSYLNERKLCVIGADSMTSQVRAIEPKFVESVNGTHTLTFKMQRIYVDEITGEKFTNPFLSLLINERKVKVLWKDKWYDLLIKNVEEDSKGRTLTYTCEDVFITELCKNGYNLEFSTELENNIGTAGDLVNQVLEGSGWTFDSSNSSKIIQYEEEAIYEVQIPSGKSFTATKQSPSRDTSITISTEGGPEKILIFYSSVIAITQSTDGVKVQFLYSPDGYATEENKMLVINGDCCIGTFDVTIGIGKLSFYAAGASKTNANKLFEVNTTQGVSNNYRAKRLVNSQKIVFDNLLGRYVNVYDYIPTGSTTSKTAYGYAATEYFDPLSVINLVSNPQNFTDTSGWTGQIEKWGVYPEFTEQSELDTYAAKGYLLLNSGYTYNSALQSNSQYLVPTSGDIKKGNTGGFHAGDEYIFRVKTRANSQNAPDLSNYVYNIVSPEIGEMNMDYSKKVDGINYFTIKSHNKFITPITVIYGKYIDVNGKVRNSNNYCYIDSISVQPNEKYTFNVTNSSSQSMTYRIHGYNLNNEWVEQIAVVEKLSAGLSTSLIFSIGEGISFIKISMPQVSFENATIYKDDWDEYLLECVTSCTINELTNTGLFLNCSGSVWLEEIQFFKKVIDSNNRIIEPNNLFTEGVTKTIYRYYNADHDEVTDIGSLKFLYEGETESNTFTPTMNNYEKMATIEAKNSNRFNILQSIAETFECWVRFEIEHDQDTGYMRRNESGLPIKKVLLVENIGEDLGWSFEYGIDLKGVKRKIKSNDICTKLIVIPNNNEFATNGFCSIARSNLNYIKGNFIMNFDYYINQGILDRYDINRDLYSTSQDYIGYFFNLRKYNTEYDELTNLLSLKQMDLLKQQSQLSVSQQQLKATIEKINDNKSAVMTLACVSSYSQAQSYIQSHTNNYKVQTLMNTIAQLENKQAVYESYVSSLSTSIQDLTSKINGWLARQAELVSAIKELDDAFFKKYSRYIQEGTWQDESYVSDDLYYLDAVDVAYTSSRPRIEYDIEVMRLTSLDDFSSKKFGVGDICYVQDKEFFGYGLDGKTPYKLEIVIHEITSYFNNPEKDSIKVANYQTQFDDLFQRIVSTTQSVQYAQGGYNRAANLIKPDKTLSFDLLQDTFDYNENLVLNANNQQVIWDSTGITLSDDKNAANKVRIIAGGIFISNDGGNSWKNAVRGDGISTDVLTAGRINTSEIYVYDGQFPSFRWDSQGINAYLIDSLGATDFTGCVRFDKFGLYGYKKATDFVPQNEASIWEEEGVKFGITWKGAFFNSGTNGNYLKFSTNSGVTPDTTLYPNAGNKVIWGGTTTSGVQTDAFWITDKGKAYFKGSVFTDGEIVIHNNGVETFHVTNTGNVTMSGGITLSGAITWNGNNPATNAEQAIASIVSGTYSGGTFIDGKNVISPNITGGIITGGIFKTTGIGNIGANSAAYYIYNGNDLKGWISYDTHQGTQWEAAERVFYKTIDNVALKIESGDNLSISAGVNKSGTIYLESNVQLLNKLVLSNAGGGYNYGSSLPSTGVEGQFFFKI